MKLPMMRYEILVHHRDWEPFLKGLRTLGMVHPQLREVPENALSDIEEKLSEARKVLGIVKKLERRSEGIFSKKPMVGEMPDGQEIIASVELEDTLGRQVAQLEREHQMLKPWGKIDWALLKTLRKKGVRMRFYECPVSKYKPEWEKEYAIMPAGGDGSLMRFAIFFQGEELPSIGIQESTLPGKYLHDLEKQITHCRAELLALREKNEKVTAWIPAIESNVRKLEEELQYRQVLNANDTLVNGKVYTITGYIPTHQAGALNVFLTNEGAAWQNHDAANDPNAPVILKNSRFAKLFEPIGALYSLPGHSDIDLTPFFAPFFLLFFGFCLGDAGYGAVLLLIASILKRRPNFTQWNAVLSLGQFFGVSTIIFGLLTGTFFGIGLADKPLPLNLSSYILDNDGLLTLALGLGFAQILFGLMIRTIRNWVEQGALYALSGLGWIGLLVSLALQAVSSGGNITTYATYASLALIVIPNKPESGWKSPLFGILDLYNITGFVGDLLSYIRLFALGISSAILGLVVNTISLKALHIPFLGPVIFVLLLVVGHGGNLMLASLSAFVHPLRLTFVEFYKNAGFNGGGKPFKPFSQTI